MTINTETRAEKTEQASASCAQKQQQPINRAVGAAPAEFGISERRQMEDSMIASGATKIVIKTEVEVLPSPKCTTASTLTKTCTGPRSRRSAGVAAVDSKERRAASPAPASKRIKLEAIETKQPVAAAPKQLPASKPIPPLRVDGREPPVKSQTSPPTETKIAPAGRPPTSESPITTDVRIECATPGPVTPDAVEKPKAAAGSTSSPNNSLPNAAEPAKLGIPLKSSKMSHLSAKYRQELEYMLREFKKLERQLLGAKARSAQSESTGSRERREKLHSFILHLEDTIRQIEEGCRLESKGESGGSANLAAAALVSVGKENAALKNLTKEKEEEEAVQKLEEHILANLLPVKVRLKKQLAAQQGATRNPVGAPTRRGMMPTAPKETGTFAVAAEKRRKAAAAAAADSTQFGTPLSGSGSSLTQKLHGPTLGSKNRPHGDGVGAKHARSQTTTEGTTKKILYAGMAPGSQQLQSGVSAASGVHKLIIESPVLLKKGGGQKQTDTEKSTRSPPVPVSVTSASVRQTGLTTKPRVKPHEDPSLPAEERRRLRKLRRKKKKRRAQRRREKDGQRQMLYATQTEHPLSVSTSEALPNVVLSAPKAAMGSTTTKKKIFVKHHLGKKGPRSVEYICALCSEAYNSTCEYNPWWALTSHECPKCRKTQIPRIDISSPSNAIEYHPALLANAEDANGSGGVSCSGGSTLAPSAVTAIRATPSHTPSGYAGNSTNLRQQSNNPLFSDSEDSDLSELSDGGSISDDSCGPDGLVGLGSLSPAEEAENENFGKEYAGPVMSEDDAQRLLVLMLHASTCPGRHRSVKHRDVCNSAKYLMLHVRDCPGTTATFDVCPFPWCRKTKHLLYHLVTCDEPEDCLICTRKGLSANVQRLVGLNDHRRKKHLERMKAAMAAAAKSKTYSPKVSYASKSTKTTITRTTPTPRRPTTSPNPYPVSGRGVSVKIGVPRPCVPTSKGPAPVSVIKATSIVVTGQSKGPNGVVLKKGTNLMPITKTTIAVPVGAARTPIVALHPGVSGGGLKPTLHPGAKAIVKHSAVVVKPLPLGVENASSTSVTSKSTPEQPPSLPPNKVSPKLPPKATAPGRASLIFPVDSKEVARGTDGSVPSSPTSSSLAKPVGRTKMIPPKPGAAKALSSGSATSTNIAGAVKGAIEGVNEITMGAAGTGSAQTKDAVNGSVPMRASVRTTGSVRPILVSKKQVVDLPSAPGTSSAAKAAPPTDFAAAGSSSIRVMRPSNSVVSNQLGPQPEKSPASGDRPSAPQSTLNTATAITPQRKQAQGTAETATKLIHATVRAKSKRTNVPVVPSWSAAKPSVSTILTSGVGAASGRSEIKPTDNLRKKRTELSARSIATTKPLDWDSTAPASPSSQVGVRACDRGPVGALDGATAAQPTRVSTKSQAPSVRATLTTTEEERSQMERSVASSLDLNDPKNAYGEGFPTTAAKPRQRRNSSLPSSLAVLRPTFAQATGQSNSAGGTHTGQAEDEALEPIGAKSKSKATKAFPQMPILPSVVKVEEEKKET